MRTAFIVAGLGPLLVFLPWMIYKFWERTLTIEEEYWYMMTLLLFVVWTLGSMPLWLAAMGVNILQ